MADIDTSPDALERVALEAAVSIANGRAPGSSVADRLAACRDIVDAARQKRWAMENGAMESLRRQLSTPGGALVVLLEHGITVEMLGKHVLDHGEPKPSRVLGLNSGMALTQAARPPTGR